MQALKTFIISFLIIISTSIYSDEVFAEITQQKVLPMQGLNLQSLNSYGFSSGIISDLSSAANSNPASLFSNHTFSTVASYQYKTEIEDALFSIGSKQSFYMLPQSAVFLYSNEIFNMSIAYNQRYNQQLNFGQIPLTSPEDMDGESGKTFEPIWKQNISAFSFITSHTLLGNEDDESYFKIGGKYAFNFLYYLEEIPGAKATLEIYAHNFSIGFNYRINASIEVGAFYEHHTEFNGNLIFKGSGFLLVPDTSGLVYEDFRLVNGNLDYNTIIRLPGKIVSSLKYNFAKDLFITGDLQYIFWNYVGDNLKNAFELSSSITKCFSEKLRGSAGIYISDRQYKNDNDIFDGLTAVYFTTGINYRLNKLMLQLSLADSHLLSDDTRKNTIGKVGIEYGF